MNLSRKVLPAILLLLNSCAHNPTSTQNQRPQMLFDHTNQLAKNGDLFQSLISRGFTTSEKAVNHPGQTTCEFISFNKGSASKKYLEFCYHNPLLPKDHIEFGKDPRDLWSGFSLRSSENLGSFFEGNKESLAEFKPIFEHKNYNWAEDNTSRLPGWNFLNFGEDPIPGIFIWVTEYEKKSKTNPPKPVEAIVHSNRATGILGMIWKGLSPKQKADLQKITAGTLEVDRLILGDGSFIQFVDDQSALGREFNHKTSAYVAVVLAVDSMSEFRKLAKPDRVIDYAGRQAALVRLSDGAWDILAVESQSPAY